MRRLRQAHHWLTVTLPEQCSAWLLHSYRRPVGLFFGLIVLPCLIIATATYALSVALWRRQTMENLRVMARLGAEILTETLDQTLLLEQLIAAQPKIVHTFERANASPMQEALEEAVQFIPRINMIMITTLEGQVIAAVPQAPVGTNIAGYEVFQTAKRQAWQPTISGVYLRDGPAIEKVVSLSVPIRSGERVVGRLQVEQRIEEIKSWLQKIRVTPQGFLYVVDQHDQLVVFPYQLIPGKPLPVSHWPPVAHPIGEDGGTLMYRSAKTGDRWLAGVYPVGALGWRVVTTQPEQAALKTLRRVFWVLALLVLLAVALVAAVGSRWLKLHAFSLDVLKQNARLLKQLQQRRFFDQGEGPPLDNPEPQP
ncbi:MAG: cache domain-containing protein [Candidatus Omnitrophica bacterium]|nr:cache domain-containing protein [Candidatus Omnitrophota bacterium]